MAVRNGGRSQWWPSARSLIWFGFGSTRGRADGAVLMPEINFSCPKCNQPIDAPSELANQLTECPACKETIEVPIRTRGQTPASTSFAASVSADESKFFQDGDIMVTNARFVVGTKTFAMRGITSIEAVESEEVVDIKSADPMRTILGGIFTLIGLFIIGAGFFCWLFFEFSFWVVVGAGVIGLLMLGIAGSLNFINYKKRAFKIVLKTAGGEVTAYKSFDRNHISQIIRALNDSIIANG